MRGNGRQFWYIIEDEYHMSIGTITYFNVDYRAGQAEMGLGLGEKSRWGRGYGPEAIRTLTAYLFTVPGMTRIYAETAEANQPARRAFAKAGFNEVDPITILAARANPGYYWKFETPIKTIEGERTGEYFKDQHRSRYF